MADILLQRFSGGGGEIPGGLTGETLKVENWLSF
jgi:hypothetical protein